MDTRSWSVAEGSSGPHRLAWELGFHCKHHGKALRSSKKKGDEL